MGIEWIIALLVIGYILYALWTYVVVPVMFFIVENFWTIMFCIIGLFVLIGIVWWLIDRAEKKKELDRAIARQKAAKIVEDDRKRIRDQQEAQVKKAQEERDRKRNQEEREKEAKERQAREQEEREWNLRCAKIMSELES